MRLRVGECPATPEAKGCRTSMHVCGSVCAVSDLVHSDFSCVEAVSYPTCFAGGMAACILAVRTKLWMRAGRDC